MHRVEVVNCGQVETGAEFLELVEVGCHVTEEGGGANGVQFLPQTLGRVLTNEQLLRQLILVNSVIMVALVALAVELGLRRETQVVGRGQNRGKGGLELLSLRVVILQNF